jgi:hypothetical protein
MAAAAFGKRASPLGDESALKRLYMPRGDGGMDVRSVLLRGGDGPVGDPGGGEG